MNEKFTPGEWFFEGENEVNTEQKNICRCIRLGMETEEMQANAHLIAAAPEMYRLLKQLHGTLSKVPVLQREIEKVLKKARGEE